MFTGIVETMGKVVSIETEGSNLHFEIESPISGAFKIDQSVSHNGVCLTIVKVKNKRHVVTAVEETLLKSNLGKLKPGDLINLERSMPANGRFEGHIVQGHIDQRAVCQSVNEMDGSWLFRFKPDQFEDHLLVEKGSVTLNGISLTCFDVRDRGFSVAIIPYTFEHTNMKYIKEGGTVNLEYDILGKYVSKSLSVHPG